MRLRISLLFKTLTFLLLFSLHFGFQGQAQVSTFPYVEDFEGFTICGTSGCNVNCTAAVANGWVQDTSDQQDWRVDNNGTGSPNTGPAVDHTLGNATGQFLYTEASGCNNQTSILLSPYFDLSGLSNPVLEFWVHMTGADMGTLTFEYAVGATGAWDTLYSQSGSIQNAIPDPWVKFDTSLSTIAFDSVHFRLTGVTGPGFESDMAFDDFSIVNVFTDDIGVSQVTSPNGLIFPTCAYTASETISVVIENYGAATQSNFPVAYQINGGTPVQETFSGSIVGGATATFSFATTANLSAGGNYDIDAFTLLVGDSMVANDSAMGSARNVLINTYPYNQSFDNLSSCSVANGPQTCDLSAEDWVQANNGVEDDDDWRIDNGGTGSGGTGPSDDRTLGNGTGNYLYTEASGTSNRSNIVYSPCFEITGLTNPILAFFYHMTGSDMGTLWVEATANGGATWDTLWTQTGEVQLAETDPWTLETISLSAYINQTLTFRFHGLTGGGFESDMALDDIYVGEDGLCFSPSVAIGTVDTTSAVLNFVSVNDTGTTFIVEYGPAGFTPGTGTTIVTTSPTDTLTGLMDFTMYDVYITEICSGGDSTNLVGPSSFTTLCIPMTIGNTDTTAIAIPSLPFADTLSTLCFTNEFTTQGSLDAYYTLTTGPCTNGLTISTCSPLSNYDTYLYLLDSTGATVASNDDAAGGACTFTLNGLNRFSIIDNAVDPNTTYFIVVDGFGTSAGTYELTVEETVSGPMVSLDSIMDITCPGDSTGAIMLTTMGSAGPAMYSWSTGDTTEDLSNLPGGTYTVTYTDSTGCGDSATFTVTEPMAFVTSDSTEDITCFGDMNGSISINVTGGSPGYSYNWSNGDSTNSIGSLDAGSYSVTVTDSLGCTTSESYTISEPTAMTASSVTVDESSPGANDGSIDLTNGGGVAAYTYVWSTGATTEDISNLAGGIYCVTITDMNNCQLVFCDTVSTLISVNVPNLNAFDMYPNPAPGRVKVSVELAATSDIQLEVLNLTGQVILTRKDEAIQNRVYELDLMDQAAGTYMVRLKVNDRAVTKPLILVR